MVAIVLLNSEPKYITEHVGEVHDQSALNLIPAHEGSGHHTLKQLTGPQVVLLGNQAQ